MDDHAAATVRAAAEVFVPGLRTDPTPGAPDVEAEHFLVHYLGYLIPGLDDGVVTLLDGLAAAHGAPFAELSLEQRTAVLEDLEHHEVEALRDLPALLAALSIASVYGEWTGQDADGAVVRPPLGWELTSYDGPVRARPHLFADGP